MEHSMNQLDRAKGRIAGDFRSMIDDGEDLLKAAAGVSGEGFAVARAKFEHKLTSARAALAEATQPVVDGTRRTAAAADSYMHGSPWTAAGVAMAAGILIGILVSKR